MVAATTAAGFLVIIITGIVRWNASNLLLWQKRKQVDQDIVFHSQIGRRVNPIYLTRLSLESKEENKDITKCAIRNDNSA